ncbi:MAG: hypothetical protein AB7O38_06600 [Pirellulaceae bacterium]
MAGATEIAALLAPRWRDWHLFRIRLADGHSDPGSRHLRYELETAGRRRIIWGQPPGTETFGEPAAAAKLLRLQRLFESAGDLDAQPPDTVWDLRHASAS